MTAGDLARFVAKIAAGDGGCWEWRAAKSKGGYGVFYLGRRLVRAHRAAYEHFIGPIPDGLAVDHTCRNTSCVRPAHLEAVTPTENARRTRTTECVHGHPRTPQNVRIRSNGQRDCRACHAARERSRRANRRNGVAA